MKSSTGKFWRVAWVAGLICAGNAGHAAEVSDLRRDPDALARSAAAGGADEPGLFPAAFPTAELGRLQPAIDAFKQQMLARAAPAVLTIRADFPARTPAEFSRW